CLLLKIRQFSPPSHTPKELHERYVRYGRHGRHVRNEWLALSGPSHEKDLIQGCHGAQGGAPFID
ncbi:MAG: hypothetical protein AB2825_18800, partial [Candidatus Thiodiazotropha endolucinida]